MNDAGYRWLDRLYRPRDLALVRRTRNLRLLPDARHRTGGKFAYAEWAHVVGIFQTLLYLHLPNKQDNQVLDIGCGTGLMAIASEPFLGPHGGYLGLDVIAGQIAFCRRHYPSPPFEFLHFDVNNPAYAGHQQGARRAWPVPDNRFDLLSALSVWTHLGEADALFYFAEIARVLKPGGKAVVTLFRLDALYRDSLGRRSAAPGRYHRTAQDRWVFDRPAYGSDAWLHPAWARTPEQAVGVTDAGLARLTEASGLALVDYHPGNWKEAPGLYFQDVLVFARPA